MTFSPWTLPAPHCPSCRHPPYQQQRRLGRWRSLEKREIKRGVKVSSEAEVVVGQRQRSVEGRERSHVGRTRWFWAGSSVGTWDSTRLPSSCSLVHGTKKNSQPPFSRPSEPQCSQGGRGFAPDQEVEETCTEVERVFIVKVVLLEHEELATVPCSWLPELHPPLAVWMPVSWAQSPFVLREQMTLLSPSVR